MESGTAIAPDATSMQQASNATTATLRRRRTRQGKFRLITLDQLDARTAAAQSARQLIATLSTDLGNDLTVGQQQLVARAALLGAITSDFETRWVAGEPIQLSDYLSACNVQRRILATLGLERRPREVPSLADYLAALRAQEANGAPASEEPAPEGTQP